ncbi:hypothetical protein KIN20_032271 [Parelaphostrongylus tenuis]|uniref:Uncharacterized protein n=1 Tax=Parelaphostrongylus tenuis TaxID=148309 RepID=A0AAD5WHY5_PARTN|nr:hypothetical protein KIN20_032271 [Parelaphostrongylus tenuis]
MEVIEAPIAAVNAALGRVAGDWADSCVSNRTTTIVAVLHAKSYKVETRSSGSLIAHLVK